MHSVFLRLTEKRNEGRKEVLRNVQSVLRPDGESEFTISFVDVVSEDPKVRREFLFGEIERLCGISYLSVSREEGELKEQLHAPEGPEEQQGERKLLRSKHRRVKR